MTAPAAPYVARDECALPSLTDEDQGVLPPGSTFACEHHMWTVAHQRFRGGPPQPVWVSASDIPPTAEQVGLVLQTPGRARMIATGNAPVPVIAQGGVVAIVLALSHPMADASYFVEVTAVAGTVALSAALAKGVVTVAAKTRTTVTLQVQMPPGVGLAIGAGIGVVAWS